MDPDFVEEELARIRAEADVEEARRKKEEKKAKAATLRRKGTVVEDVGLEEIK